MKLDLVERGWLPATSLTYVGKIVKSKDVFFFEKLRISIRSGCQGVYHVCVDLPIPKTKQNAPENRAFLPLKGKERLPKHPFSGTQMLVAGRVPSQELIVDASYLASLQVILVRKSLR